MPKTIVEISKSNHRGQCFCGLIKFSVTGETFWSAICHCNSCRETSGAPIMAWTGFMRKQVKWKGPARKEFPSSEGVLRGFCGTCGTTLSYSGHKFGTENVFLSTTTFENPDVFVPTEQVFSCESLAWLSLNDSIPKVDML